MNRWTAESVRVYSSRAYSQDGEPRDPMYNTRIRLDAEFVDFEKLSEFIDTWSGEEGVAVDHVRWRRGGRAFPRRVKLRFRAE
ncbi:hypothetical protein V525_14930 [Gordonia alkanivorans CGMCC 6845]|uniref:Uncharacterized protein n=1 Tax=Gordonia alkanivorans CGMCC 6845 TaxID=1423140 RepID=W9DI13_9ACTN|nr:hypothetical protein V525_14930 [Gordonia alkanivorans CGMCC 6845]